jgi:hypothetical protein
VLDLGSDSFYVSEYPENPNGGIFDCIPNGVYHVTRAKRSGQLDHWLINDVPGRAGIYLTDNPTLPQQEGSMIIGNKLVVSNNSIRVGDRRAALWRLNTIMQGVNSLTLYVMRSVPRAPQLKVTTVPSNKVQPHPVD